MNDVGMEKIPMFQMGPEVFELQYRYMTIFKILRFDIFLLFWEIFLLIVDAKMGLDFTNSKKTIKARLFTIQESWKYMITSWLID